jgi:hypothetical protein
VAYTEDTAADDKKAARASESELASRRSRFKWCAEKIKKDRDIQLEDRQFLRGRTEDQWPAAAIARANQLGLPIHTLNRLPQFLRQVSNGMRQNRVAAKVSPVDDAGDIKVAEVMQGAMRHIEYMSKADVVYVSAGFDAAASGEGFWIVEPQRCDPRSFDQEIRLCRVRNPFTIYLDPNAQEPDGSDAEFGFKITTMSLEDFQRDFPKASVPSDAEWTDYTQKYAGWYSSSGDQKNVMIAEYYYKELTDDMLYELKDGSLKLLSELDGVAPDKKFVVDERETQISVVKWCKMTATEELSSTVLPGSGKWIPIVRVVGEELDVNGEVTRSGVIRHAKDAQRELNYMRSKRTKAIGLAPTAPYIMAEGQQEGHEEGFQNANITDPPFLLYKPIDLNGNLAPPPRRETTEPPVQALTIACQDAADDMKATTGVYDAQQGAQSNETSGRAINARVVQGETSNFHIVDNLALSIGHSCRIILDWFPDVYDRVRTMRIIGEDDTHSVVTTIGKTVPQEARAGMNIHGQEQQSSTLDAFKKIFAGSKKPSKPVYDISVGTYDVICSAGPSFASKRQQASEQLTNLAQVWPALLQFAPDLVAKSIDVPYAQEIAERAKKTLPPGLQDQPEGAPEIPPEVQQQLAQMQQQTEALTQALNEASQQIETKAHDAASKERMNTENNEVKKYIAELNATNTAAIADMQAHSDAAFAVLQTELQKLSAQFAPTPEAPQGEQPPA